MYVFSARLCAAAHPQRGGHVLLRRTMLNNRHPQQGIPLHVNDLAHLVRPQNRVNRRSTVPPKFSQASDIQSFLGWVTRAVIPVLLSWTIAANACKTRMHIGKMHGIVGSKPNPSQGIHSCVTRDVNLNSQNDQCIPRISPPKLSIHLHFPSVQLRFLLSSVFPMQPHPHKLQKENQYSSIRPFKHRQTDIRSSMPTKKPRCESTK